MILRALVLRPIVHEKLRTIITILGIAVGVAVVVAIQLANQSALRAFRESVDAVAGRANYQIASDAVPLSEDVLLRLRPLWERGVRFAPVIDVEGIVQPKQIPIRLLAVDLLSDLHFRDYRYARIVTTRKGAPETSATRYLDLFRDDSVVLPASFANELGIETGDQVELNIGGQRAVMTLRGVLEPHGPATAFNGAIAICDIATAQKRFGFKGRLTRIDLLVPAETESETLASIRRVLPPGARLERPSRRNERVEKMLRAFRVNLFALAGIALLVGMLLVYNAVLISILRRRRDVGIVKTLGVAPRQIFAAFLGEGLLFGLLGSAGGVILGKALAIAILRSIGRTINNLYVASQPDAIALTGGVIAVGVAVGVLLSLFSAIQPSFEASRVPPNTMIRPGLQQRVSRARERSLVFAAAGCLVAAIGVALLPPVRGLAVAGYVSVLLVVIGFSLLAPAIVRATSLLLRPVLERAFGIVGTLSAASLPASLRRTAVASAALSLATGMMIAVALMVGSFRETVRIWVDQTVQSDMWLRPSKGLSNAQVALFPNAISDDLRRVDFIAAIDRARATDIVYGDSIITIGYGDFDISAQFGDLPMVTRRSAKRALIDAERIGGVVISESFSLKFRKNVGDSVPLATIQGTRNFPITGVYRDYSNDRGTVIMDRA
ncbi:MAG: ABC transporter permease, partial [Thermoanaerobaculia bacterium]